MRMTEVSFARRAAHFDARPIEDRMVIKHHIEAVAMSPESSSLIVELPSDLAKRVAEIAAARELSSADVIASAVRALIDDEDAYLALIDEAIAEADKGEFVSGEKAEAWLRSWGTDRELPMPEPDIFLNKSA